MSDIQISPRHTWGGGSSRASLDLAHKRNFVVHFSDGQGRKRRTFKQMATVVKGIYDYHTRGQGWDDIGYSFIVFQPWWRRKAVIFRGRGWLRIPAANQGHNSGSIAVCVIARPGEPALGRTVTALKQLYRQSPCTVVKGHRDYNNTDCPGDALYATLAEIRRAK